MDKEKDGDKKEYAEIEWDEVVQFAFKNLKVFKQHEHDRVYWSNEGEGKHLEDDLSEEINNWDDLSDEEKQQVIQAITSAMVFMGIMSCGFGCLWCCCMCAGACCCLKDCQKNKVLERKIKDATIKQQQRLQKAEQN